MTTTNIDIASLALTTIRANTISSLTEGTEEADIVTIYYDTFIEYIFSKYPWTFALEKRQLNRNATAPVNEFTYAYDIPAEALKVFACYDSGQPGARPFQRWRRIGNQIHTDEPTLYAEYTVYVAENYWSGTFKKYAYHALAEMIAMPVTDDQGTYDMMKTIAHGTPAEAGRGGLFAEAAAEDSKGTPPEEIVDNPIIGARFS